ncbi:MAG: hypothetical protein H6923_11085 [Alphaproteobacteria bacterium]|nr:hypothetical protein [Alphaproteobacteria bacterium]
MGTRLALIAAAAVAFVTCFVVSVWTATVWLASVVSPVGAGLILAGAFFAIGMLALATMAATRPRQPAPASLVASAGLELLGTPAQADVAAIARLCENRPLAGLAVAFGLGLVQGLNEPRR